MTKIAMWPKIAFSENSHYKNNLEQKGLWNPKLDPNLLFGQYHCKADGPSISEHTYFKLLHHKLWENLVSEVG